MCITRYSLGLGLLCAAHLYALHHESPGCCRTGAVVERQPDYAIWGYVMVVLRPLSQPGERLCYSCRASQERVIVSAVPMRPWVFFQPLSSRLAYLGFSEQCKQCEQWDRWYRKLKWTFLPAQWKWRWQSLSCVQLFATPWDSPGQNTGVGSLSLLQGIFPTQGSNPHLPALHRSSGEGEK